MLHYLHTKNRTYHLYYWTHIFLPCYQVSAFWNFYHYAWYQNGKYLGDIAAWLSVFCILVYHSVWYQKWKFLGEMLYSFKTARCIGWFFLSFSYPVSGDYFAPVDASGRRVDLDQRPELLKSSIEFIAPAEYMVRPPMPPLYFFLIDVSIFAVKSGMLEVKYLIKIYIVLGRGLCILFMLVAQSSLSLTTLCWAEIGLDCYTHFMFLL